MNSMRQWLCILTAVMLATFALQGVGAPTTSTKQYSLNMTVPAQGSTAPFTVLATVMNISPPPATNSNISSFSLSVSSVSGLRIVGVDTPVGGGTASVTSPTSISVTGLSPVKGGQSVTVTLHVNTCGDDAVWSAMVYTGTNLTGIQFNQNQLPGASLTTSIPCGDLACGESFTVPDSTNPSMGSPGYVTGRRGVYNTDGTINGFGCNLVDYIVTNTILANDYLHFEWDSESTAVFFYTIIAKVPNPTPEVAWLTDLSGTPVFIKPGPSCLSSNLPAPLGTLAADIGQTDVNIPVNSPIPTGQLPITPFPIVIGFGPTGTSPERMVVTKVTGNLWTVVRGDGHTTPTSHTTGASVMTTPLPILQAGVPSPYIAGDQAQVCVAGQGQGLDAGNNTYYFINFIDGEESGNGWVGGSP